MFRQFLAGMAALALVAVAAPERAKADNADLAVGAIFGALLGGVLVAVIDDDDDDKGYRNKKVYREKNVYYGRPHYGGGHNHHRRHVHNGHRRHHGHYRHHDTRKRYGHHNTRRYVGHDASYADGDRKRRYHGDTRVVRRVDRRVERRVYRKKHDGWKKDFARIHDRSAQELR